MALKTEWVRFGGEVGYLATPERASSAPGVVVIQEIYGVNDHIMDVTRRIAAAGYTALAPDLFAKDGSRPPALAQERIQEVLAFVAKLPPGAMWNKEQREAALAKEPKDLAERLSATFAAIAQVPTQINAMVAPLREAVRYLKREQPTTKGMKVACVGFCMGGSLSALLPCEEPELDGAAVFYGSSPAPEKVASIRCPVLAFYGEKDERVNASIPQFEEGMKKTGARYEKHVYAGAAHAFFNDTGASYDIAAARDAYARLLAFFRQTLVE